MRTQRLVALTAICAAVLACAPGRSSSETVSVEGANAGIDALNARLVEAYRRRDPAAYGALYTDAAVFEWPAFNSVRGPAALATMAQENWAGQRDVELRLHVASRRLAPDHATEFGAFEQSWTDSARVRRTEFGRYASLLVRQEDGSWRMERFFGFEDSTRAVRSGSDARRPSGKRAGESLGTSPRPIQNEAAPVENNTVRPDEDTALNATIEVLVPTHR